jgi:hypothetical protein
MIQTGFIVSRLTDTPNTCVCNEPCSPLVAEKGAG